MTSLHQLNKKAEGYIDTALRADNRRIAHTSTLRLVGMERFMTIDIQRLLKQRRSNIAQGQGDDWAYTYVLRQATLLAIRKALAIREELPERMG